MEGNKRETSEKIFNNQSNYRSKKSRRLCSDFLGIVRPCRVIQSNNSIGTQQATSYFKTVIQATSAIRREISMFNQNKVCDSRIEELVPGSTLHDNTFTSPHLVHHTPGWELEAHWQQDKVCWSNLISLLQEQWAMTLGPQSKTSWKWPQFLFWNNMSCTIGSTEKGSSHHTSYKEVLPRIEIIESSDFSKLSSLAMPSLLMKGWC